MQIIDSQIHLWTGAQAPPHHFRAPFTVEDALREMGEAGVSGAVNCPALWDPEANEYAVEVARADPERFATLGWFDLAVPRSDAFLKDFVSQPGMLGVRFVLVMPDQQKLFADGALEWLWAAADKLALPVGLMVHPSMYGEVARIARQYPQMRLLIDHLGVGPFTKLPDAALIVESLLALAAEPNVAVKASGVPSMATDDYPFASTHPVLRRTFEAFGPKRMFWGTDYTRMQSSWRECVTMFTEELDWLKGEDLEWVMGRGVREWIGWT
jgi:predicted TIM-barrel fold metal-dependent hydrolase